MLLKGVAYCHTHSIMHRVRRHTDVVALSMLCIKDRRVITGYYSMHVCALWSSAHEYTVTEAVRCMDYNTHANVECSRNYARMYYHSL